MMIISRYLYQLYCKSLIITLCIFLSLYTLIDFFTSQNGNFANLYISIFEGINSIDNLSCFIFLIASLVTLIKLKSKSEDIALLSLGYSPRDILNKFIVVSCIFYIIYIFILQPISVGIVANANVDNINGSSAKTKNKNTITIEMMNYNCNNYDLIDNIILTYDSKSYLSQGKFLNINNKAMYDYNIHTNEIYQARDKKVKTMEDISNICTIERYKRSIIGVHASLYKVIYAMIYDRYGIMEVKYLYDMIFIKLRNIALSIISINLSYFFIISHKRSMKSSINIVYILLFTKLYYIISLVIDAQLKYISNIFVYITGTIGVHFLLITYLYHIQYHCLANVREILIDIRSSFRGVIKKT